METTVRKERIERIKMHDRKKERAIALLGIVTALMLLAGCEGQGIQKRTELEDPDTASQLQQNIKEEDISDEISPEQSEESKQLGLAERADQLKETERLLEEESDERVQNKLDADRIIEEQSFQVELNDWGEVRFVSYEPDSSKRDLQEDVTFYLLKDEEVLYQFPYISEDYTSGYGFYWDVKFIIFTDTNAD